jgi:anti-sigma-K factor RskA
VRLRREDPHTLAGAYALDALPEPDRARFERHLARCDDCGQEASSLRGAASRLAAVTATPPPARLREQVLGEAARTRQQPPLIPEGPPSPGAGWRGLRLRAPRMAVAIAGVCILVALVLGGLFINTQQRLSQEQAHSREIAMILNAPDATIMSARGATGGTATVVMSHRDRALVLTTASLPALHAGQRYQVWLMGVHRTRAAGMLPDPRRGVTAPVIVSGIENGDMVGLTVEPAGGSSRPTSAPVVMLVLPS